MMGGAVAGAVGANALEHGVKKSVFPALFSLSHEIRWRLG